MNNNDGEKKTRKKVFHLPSIHIYLFILHLDRCYGSRMEKKVKQNENKKLNSSSSSSSTTETLGSSYLMKFGFDYEYKKNW